MSFMTLLIKTEGCWPHEVKSLSKASDAAFEDYRAKLASLLQHKSKAFKEEQD